MMKPLNDVEEKVDLSDEATMKTVNREKKNVDRLEGLTIAILKRYEIFLHKAMLQPTKPFATFSLFLDLRAQPEVADGQANIKANRSNVTSVMVFVFRQFSRIIATANTGRRLKVTANWINGAAKKTNRCPKNFFRHRT